MADMEERARIESLSSLHEAEERVISAVESAGAAFQALSAADVSGAQDAHGHSERFIKDLYMAQRLVRSRIALLSSDLPFENATLRWLIDADLAVQRTSHVHRALVRTLRRLSDASAPQGRQPLDGTVTEELLDSSGMTPPAAQFGADSIMPGVSNDARMNIEL